MFFAAGFILLTLILINQFREKPLTGKLYRQPLALLLFTGCSLSFMPSIVLADWFIISVAFMTSLILGMLQGCFTPLVGRGGTWYISGSIFAVLVWSLSIPIRFILKFISAHYFSLSPALNGSSGFIIYFIFIAGFLLGRYTMLFLRYPSLIRKTMQNEQKLKHQHAR